jgi:hypothetical protein
MSRDRIGEIVTLAEQNGSLRSDFKLRTMQMHKDLYVRCISLLRSRENASDGSVKEVKKLLDSLSMQPVYNAYWDLPMDKYNAYGATMPGILHMISQGIGKKLKDSIFDLLDDTNSATPGKSVWAVIEIEAAMRDLPQFTDGNTTIAHFSNGVWALSWVSAEDMIAMMQQLLFAISIDTTAKLVIPVTCGTWEYQAKLVRTLDMFVHVSYCLHSYKSWSMEQLDNLETSLAKFLELWKDFNAIAEACGKLM